MNDRFSRANTHLGKAHILDHKTGKTLCNSAFKRTVMVTTKKRYDASEMYERHSAIPRRRTDGGAKNPYKYCCQKCEEKIKTLTP